MQCQNCHSENPHDAIFCNKCGNRILQDQTSFATNGNRKIPADIYKLLLLGFITAAIFLGGVAYFLLMAKEESSPPSIESFAPEVNTEIK